MAVAQQARLHHSVTVASESILSSSERPGDLVEHGAQTQIGPDATRHPRRLERSEQLLPINVTIERIEQVVHELQRKRRHQLCMVLVRTSTEKRDRGPCTKVVGTRAKPRRVTSSLPLTLLNDTNSLAFLAVLAGQPECLAS